MRRSIMTKQNVIFFYSERNRTSAGYDLTAVPINGALYTGNHCAAEAVKRKGSPLEFHSVDFATGAFDHPHIH